MKPTTDDADRLRKNNEAMKMKSDYNSEKGNADTRLRELKKEYKQKTEEYLNLDAKTANEKGQIEHLESLIKMDWKEQEKKLTVKIWTRSIAVWTAWNRSVISFGDSQNLYFISLFLIR